MILEAPFKCTRCGRIYYMSTPELCLDCGNEDFEFSPEVVEEPLDLRFITPLKIGGHAVEMIKEINKEYLTNEDIINISNAIMNDYVPHEEPYRSAVLKLHRIADSLRK